MSNELDLHQNDESLSPANKSETEEIDHITNTANSTEKTHSDTESCSTNNNNNNGNDSKSEVKASGQLYCNNKRKKKPIKASMLLLKCVEANGEEEEEEEAEVAEGAIEDEEEVAGRLESLRCPTGLESNDEDEEDQFGDEGELVENEPEAELQMDEDGEEGSFGMEESNCGSEYNASELEVQNADAERPKSGQSQRSRPAVRASFQGASSNGGGVPGPCHSPLANNAFLNNRNMELFALLEKQQQQIHQHGQSYSHHAPAVQQQQQPQSQPQSQSASSKKQMRFQCRFCVYKSHSVSLMQNHIYRHIDTTPYSCFYCGHKSTTKSTIMVHIELCHPNMEVKIKESRVKEEDFYIDLNASNAGADASLKSVEFLKENKHSLNKFEIIPNKCQVSEAQQQAAGRTG